MTDHMSDQAGWKKAFEEACAQALNVDAYTFQIAWAYAIAPTQGADGYTRFPDVLTEEGQKLLSYSTQGADARPVATMDDMRMLIQRLAHSLRKASPDNALSDQAMGYLKRMGLVGTPLRDVATRDAAPSDAAIDALKWIKVLVCGDSAPRWTNAHQTTISRGMIADIVDKAIAASTPREKT